MTITATTDPATGRIIRFNPPWIDPKQAFPLPPGNSFPQVPGGQSGRFTVPDGRTGRVIVVGGKDVIVEGVPMPNGGRARGTNTVRVNGTMGDGRTVGSVTIQDMTIDLGALVDLDNIAVAPAQPIDLIVQRATLIGSDGDRSGVHPDLIQGQGPLRNVYICDVKGSYWYQGIFLRNTNDATGDRRVEAAWLTRVSIEDLGGRGKGLWFGNAGGFPVYLDEVSIKLYPGRRLLDSVHPGPGARDAQGADIGARSDDGGASVYWAPAARITGKVTAAK